jgi:hypothetical protein
MNNEPHPSSSRRRALLEVLSETLLDLLTEPVEPEIAREHAEEAPGSEAPEVTPDA